MRTKVLLIAGTGILAAGLTLAGTPQRWFNVDVSEPRDETEVHLHLPVSLVQTVLGAVETSSVHHGKVMIDCGHVDLDWPAILKELRAAPEGQYVTVKSPDADVVMRKSGGLVLINVRSRDEDAEQVDVRIPTTMLNAFVVDEHGNLDLGALAAGLGSMGPGELVRVTGKDASVRIWVE